MRLIPRPDWTWSGGRLLIPLALLLMLLASPAALNAEDEEKPTAAKPDGAAPKPDDKKPEAKKRDPLLPLVEAQPKAFKDFAEAVRRYFDLDEELWKGRKALLEHLEQMAAKGQYPLKDMDFLRWLVAEGRAFDPDMKDRKWQRSQGIAEAKSLAGTLYWIKSEGLQITFSLPRKYPKLKDLRGKYPRAKPYPLLLAMHEKRDYTGKRYPGEALVKRRYPKKVWGKLFDSWAVLIPEAPAGNFLNKDGMVRAEVFRNPFARFWRHYHVDFDRIVLDGTKQAFPVATALPVFFSGLIFRGKWKLESDGEKATVKNFASVPVYVVDNPTLAKQLKEAGHPNVTAGISGPVLIKWMNERKRKLPTKFEWNARVLDQLLPYWINLDSPNWSAKERTLKVEVVDTEEEPNTIRLEAVGINDLTLFLNDEIVDLDRKVRVVINENLEHDALLEPGSERMRKIGRDLDLLFNTEPVRIRNSMFYGWLKTARIVRLVVRPPPEKEEPKPPPKDEGPKATPEEEATAKRLMEKLKHFMQSGTNDRAIEYAKRILEMPRNAQSKEAQDLLDKLEAESK